MARGKKAANGKTQVQMVLELLSCGKEVSPVNINAATGTKYASKFISTLRKEGYDIKSVKEGRSVVAYVLLNGPAVAAAPAVAEEDEADEDVSSEAKEFYDGLEEEVTPMAASADDEDEDYGVADDWDEYDGDVRTLVS